MVGSRMDSRFRSGTAGEPIVARVTLTVGRVRVSAETRDGRLGLMHLPMNRSRVDGVDYSLGARLPPLS